MDVRSVAATLGEIFHNCYLDTSDTNVIIFERETFNEEAVVEKLKIFYENVEFSFILQ